MVVITYVFGALLVLGLVAAFFYYFSPKRKGKVEQPKFDMLKDEE